MKGNNPWQTLSSRSVYENDWVRVREDEVIQPDGQKGIYGVIEIPASVGIVAVNDNDEIALAGQWRYPLGRYSWEIPRGGSHGDPNLLGVAQPTQTDPPIDDGSDGVDSAESGSPKQ